METRVGKKVVGTQEIETRGLGEMGQTEWAGGLGTKVVLPEPHFLRPQDATDVEWK